MHLTFGDTGLVQGKGENRMSPALEDLAGEGI